MKKEKITGFFQTLESTKWFLISAFLFRFFLEISYRQFVNPLYEYAGFKLDVDIFKYVESLLIYIIIVCSFPAKLTKASDYLMVYLLFSFLAPLLVYYGLSNSSRSHLYIVLLGVAMIVIFRNGRPINLPVVKEGRQIAVGFMLFGAALVTLWMFLSGGLGYFNLDLSRVYEFRQDVGALINQGPMGYVNIWTTKVFGPFLLALSLWRKNVFFVVLILSLHLIWFGITSHKAVLFCPMLIIFLWLWFRSYKALALIPICLSLVIMISLAAYFIVDDIMLGSLFVRRTFFVPSTLTFVYYDFFSSNPLVYWSESITSSFIDYPYHMSAPRIIGQHLGTLSHANNSFLSTGYMHAGVPGVILYGVLTGFIFRVFDSLSDKGVPPWVAVAIVIVPGKSLITDTDLPTALLTHGFGIALVLLFLYRSSKEIKSG